MTIRPSSEPHLNHSVQGSSALAPYYSVQGLIDTVQIFALLLGTIGSFTTRDPRIRL